MSTEIYDAKGWVIGNVELSENQLRSLDMGEVVSVQYHTPRAFRAQMGVVQGRFDLGKFEGRIVSHDPDSTRKCAELHAAVKQAREGG